MEVQDALITSRRPWQMTHNLARSDVDRRSTIFNKSSVGSSCGLIGESMDSIPAYVAFAGEYAQIYCLKCIASKQG